MKREIRDGELFADDGKLCLTKLVKMEQYLVRNFRNTFIWKLLNNEIYQRL